MSNMIKKYIFEEAQRDGGDPIEIEISDKHKNEKVITFSIEGYSYDISFDTAKDLVKVINEILGIPRGIEHDQVVPLPPVGVPPQQVISPYYPCPPVTLGNTTNKTEEPAPKPKLLPTADKLMAGFMGGGS